MKGERRKFWMGLIFAILFVTFAFVSVGCASGAATLYVNPGESIQAAVDAANSGDTIIVRDGTYTENVEVNVANLTLRSENGSENCIVNAFDQNDHVFNVTAEWVNISGFTVQNATGTWKAGIFLNTVYHCTISENTALNNYNGVYLDSSSNNSLTGNTANSNNNSGIALDSSSNNALTGNTAHSNNYYGIELDSSSNNNNLTGNTASNNYRGIGLYYSSNNNLTGNTVSKNNYGIELYYSSSNNLTSNTVSNNYVGIYLYYSSYNTLTGNTANSNLNYGIYLYHSSSNNLIGNTANSNLNYGIYLQSLSNNTLTGNTVSKNNYGIYLNLSSNNLIYNNYFNNTNNAFDDRNNIWNISKTHGTNIIGGSWLGGNYWSDYTGTDTNGDGLGDTLLPYNSSGNIQNGGDWLPLVMAEEDPYTNIDVGVTSNITLANSSDLIAYLPPEYDGMDISDAVVLNVDVADDTPGNPVDDAYTDITINAGSMNIATCKVFKAGMAFLPEVSDVTTLATVDGDQAFSRDLGNNTVTIRLYVGDPLLAVLPPAELPIFDTSEGTYPSISGIFTGTITPSRDLNVSTLYTYYCKGTGGYTKSIELYENATLIASGVWDGYQDDWHNITLSSEVTLLKDHEYRYVIETGSYPQIIHDASKEVTGGVITCTSFEDANGNVHTDWIPAIRLF